MIDVILDRGAVNLEALDFDLRAALGSAVFGVTLSDNRLVVHLRGGATPGEISQARAIVQAHDPAVLTPAQQAELLRRQKLEQARQDYRGVELDLSPYEASPLLLVLARKIAWLEREIAALRKLSE